MKSCGEVIFFARQIYLWYQAHRISFVHGSLAHRSDSAFLLHGCIGGQRRPFSEIPALGTELPCPHCGKSIRLNPFTINADWRQVAKAWGKDVPGEKEMGDRSKMDTSIRKSEESAVNDMGKVEEKVKKPWWKLW